MCGWIRFAAALLVALLVTRPALAAEDSLDFALGKALFERLWVSAPSSTKSADGLGPLFNARACSSCHQGGGRAAIALEPGKLPASAALTLRVGTVEDGKLVPHPVLGLQIQTMAVTGLAPEASLLLSYETRREHLADGTVVELRRPRLAVDASAGVSDLAWLSPRLAPDLHGAGLLERVPLSRLADLADPDDLDLDGISGAIVMGQYGEAGIEPGRFGWKADEPDLAHQISAAFHFDLGLATSLRSAAWGDCTDAEADCRSAPHGAAAGEAEVGDNLVALIATYLRGLPSPRASQAAAGTERGAAVFADIGCASCHTPRQLAQATNGAAQWFSPYTDLLVHDMGDGLADRAADDSVSVVSGAREWRTAPLWSLGARVAQPTGANLLHDGRARSILEAILWHGGEAAPAKDRAASLSAEDRAALISFLEGL